MIRPNATVRERLNDSGTLADILATVNHVGADGSVSIVYPDGSTRVVRTFDVVDVVDLAPVAWRVDAWDHYEESSDPGAYVMTSFFPTFESALESVIRDHVGDVDSIGGLEYATPDSAWVNLYPRFDGCARSLARIRPVSGVDGFDRLAERTSALDSSDGESAYYADDVDVNYQTGARSRLSWHLVAPTDSESGSWSVREIRDRYEHAEDCSALDGCSDACTEPIDSDIVEHDLFDLLESDNGLPFH